MANDCVLIRRVFIGKSSSSRSGDPAVDLKTYGYPQAGMTTPFQLIFECFNRVGLVGEDANIARDFQAFFHNAAGI